MEGGSDADVAVHPASRRRWLTPGVIVGAVFTVCLVVSLMAFELARRYVRLLEDRRFREIAERAREAFETHTAFYLKELGAFAGLESMGDTHTRVQMDRFMEGTGLRSSHKGLFGIGFCKRVPSALRETHERQMRASYQADYGVSPASLEGDDLFPIVLYEDFSANRAVALGWNPASDALRWDAMRSARDTGTTVISRPTRLHIGGGHDGPKGLLAFVPVFENGKRPSDNALRVNALQGFVFAGMLPDELWDEVIRREDRVVLRLRVYQGEVRKEEGLVYDSIERAAGPSPRGRHSGIMTMSGLGQTWTLAFDARPAFYAEERAWVPWAVLACGVGLTLSLTALTWGEVRGRSRAEALSSELAHSQALYFSLVEAMPQVVFRKDVRGRYTFVNEAFCSLVGKSSGAVLGKSPAELGLIVQEETEETDQSRVLRDGITVSGIRCFRSGAGTESFWYLIKTPLKGRNGVVEGLQAIMWDVTSEQQSRRRLQAEKEQLAVTLRSLAEGVVTTDVDGRVTTLNATAEQLTGWNSADASGRPLAEVLPLRFPGAGVGVGESWNPPACISGEGSLRSRGGRERSVAVSAAELRDFNGGIRGWVVVVNDITERQKLEEERQKRSRLESLGLLAGGIAHDFKNLLMAIVGNVSLARGLTAPEGELATCLAEVERVAYRAKDLTGQLLTFAKGGAPLKRPLRIDTLVADCAMFASRGTAARCDILGAENLPLVEGDQAQLEQVFQNLVINGIQAMPMGGRIQIAFNTEESAVVVAGSTGTGEGATTRKRMVRVSVSDEGPGIAPDVIARIFDPYFTTKRGGSGLGLTTALSIVERHGGKLLVESPSRGGAVFHVILPACEAALAKPPPAAVPALALSPGRERRVLVLDDEAAVGRVVCAMLTRLGFKPDLVMDGAEAISRFNAACEAGAPYAIAILDLTIPGGMGGREVAAKLRGAGVEVALVVSSGYSTDPVLSDHGTYGFDRAIEKPFRLDDLRRVLQSLHSDEAAGAAASRQDL